MEYIIEKKEPFGKWVQLAKTSDTSYKVKGLKEGQEYEFRVAAVNKAGVGSFSEATLPTVAKEPYGKCLLIALRIILERRSNVCGTKVIPKMFEYM